MPMSPICGRKLPPVSSDGMGDEVADREPVATVHELVSQLDYPMFIVTAAARGERAGCLVGFATQCSINPPRFLLCLSDKNRTYRVAQHAQILVVHLVPEDAAD